MPTAPASAAVCATTSSSVTSPSARPSVNAKPELVVASALKPSSSSIRAEPASHGFGMTNGSPSWRARKALLVSCKLMLVGGDRALVALHVWGAPRHVDLAADLLDPEEVAHLVACVRRQRQRHPDERPPPGRNEDLETWALQRLRDRARDLLRLDQGHEARRPHARRELGTGQARHDRRDLDAGSAQLRAQRVTEADDRVL